MGGGGTNRARLFVALAAAVAALYAPAAATSAADIDWTNRTLPPGVTRSTITVGSLHTRIYQAGNPHAREAIVFVHGHPGSADDWPHLASVAADHGRAVALDMVGFGGASKPAPADFPYTPAGEGDFLDQAFKALGIDRADLVLHDFGGPFGLEWARRHPRRVNSVVLLNTGVFENYYGHPFAFVWHTPGLGELDMDAQNRELFGAEVQVVSLRPLPQDWVDTAWSHYDAASRAAWLAMYRSYPTLTSADEMGRAEAAALRPYHIPALVIWGETDPFLPVYVAFEQQDAFPGAKVDLLDAGHFPFIELPDEVDSLVRPFWAEHVGRPGKR